MTFENKLFIGMWPLIFSYKIARIIMLISWPRMTPNIHKYCIYLIPNGIILITVIILLQLNLTLSLIQRTVNSEKRHLFIGQKK